MSKFFSRKYIHKIFLLSIYCILFISCKNDLSSNEITEPEFYEISYYMAHAFGAINGETYTNSKEAFYNAINLTRGGVQTF